MVQDPAQILKNIHLILMCSTNNLEGDLFVYMLLYDDNMLSVVKDISQNYEN